MADNEIYRGKEDWELADDARRTLRRDTESIVSAAGDSDGEKGRQEEAARKKHRKLTTKGMALFTSAVVTMGLLSGSISGRSDSGPYDPEDRDVICPVCSTVNCEFWSSWENCEEFSVAPAEDALAYEMADQHFGVASLYFDWRTMKRTVSAIRMADGRRALFSPAVGLRTAGTTSTSHYYVFDEDTCFDETTGTAVHDSFYLLGNGTGQFTFEESKYGGLIQLIYAPGGEVPAEFTYIERWEEDHPKEKNPPLRFCATKPVEGEPELWLRSYSNYTQALADEGLERSSVLIWDDGNHFALGNSLEFDENALVKLSGNCGHIQYSTFDTYPQDRFVITSWYGSGCEYELIRRRERDGRYYRWIDLMIMENSFEDLCRGTQERAVRAEERGHLVTTRIRKIDEVTVNDLKYDVYMAGHQGYNVLATSWTLYFSPQVEPNIALRYALSGSNTKVFADNDDMNRIDEIDSLSDLNVYRELGCASAEDFLKADIGYYGSIMEYLECIRLR